MAYAWALVIGLSLSAETGAMDTHRCDLGPGETAICAGCLGDVAEGPYTEAELRRMGPQRLPAHLLNSPDAAPPLLAGDVPLTIVLDFNDPGQPNTSDIIGNEVTTFDVTGYGFDASDFGTVTNAILAEVRAEFLDIPGSDEVAACPMPPNERLCIDIVIGDVGTPPSNGATEYYYIQIGSNADSGGPLGQACYACVRLPDGDPGGIANGSVVGTSFTDNINGLSGLTPSDALLIGDIDFTKHAIAGTTAHEIGHVVALLHLNKTGSVTPFGTPPTMGTGAIDLPSQDRIFNREFAISGNNSQNGGAEQFHIQRLINSVGIGCGVDPSCPWDCGDSDGSVGTADLLALLAQWGGPGACDFNDSGTITTADLLELLANWGDCV